MSILPNDLELHGREIWMGAGGEGIMNLATNKKHIVTETFNRNGKVLTHPPPPFPVCFPLLEIFQKKTNTFSRCQKRSEPPGARTRILEMRSFII